MTEPGPAAALPPVSVVLAVRNEAEGLAPCVEAIHACGYRGELEVVVAVAPSDDGTEAVAQRLADDGLAVIVDNPEGFTPVGLNRAIAAAQHDVLVRMDGHALMPAGYIDLAVAALASTGAANVGGRMVPRGGSPFSRAVAVAMSSRFGLGGAGHRMGGQEGQTESVYLGSFRRDALASVGGYDEHFVRAQDWELNHRLRQAGHEVWFVPGMAVPYTPRSTWRALNRQFYSTGRWRREVARRHPESLSVRYLAAPLVTIAVFLGLVAGVSGLVVGWPWLAAALIVPAGYLVGVLGATLLLLPRTGLAAALRMPVVLMTMHLAWGAGFLRGVR
ncbi:glycosyltransferase family 2 protein [Demequina sp.]|uniref:glycosyltransferase family 2 protein n=1 Tax=Demequina sp. TaxID=2050685 RepID=UPI003A84FA97